MTESLQTQMEKLRSAIQSLEAQKELLGDELIHTALAPMLRELAALEQQAAAQSVPAEDRRMVTILFTDMVGSTSMAEKMDPEEWRRVVSKMHSAIGDAIAAHHGTIAQYLGDGLLAFFGAREASEADPENAIRAALDAVATIHTAAVAVAAIHELPLPLPHELPQHELPQHELSQQELPLPQELPQQNESPVQIRIGIHTGLVVVGELGAEAHKEFTASGDAMNLAARLQSAAPPGGILISHDTFRYVRGVFDVTPRPPLTVKGKREPIQTYLVRQAKPRPFRTVARGVAGVETRTVGREAEMQALQQAYLRAYEGHGMVWAQLLGDPGVGKSRLLVELNDWMELRPETYRLLRARAFPDDLSQPFALVRRMWFDRFQIADGAPLEQAERKWVERFKEFSGLSPNSGQQADCEEAAHALGLLVGLSFENSPYIRAMRTDPAQVKGRALVVSRELLKAARAQFPVVVLLEDLQWSDAASQEYLMEVFLGESELLPNGLFILGAARPEWRPPGQLADLFSTSLPNVIACASTAGTGARSSLPRAERRVLGDARTCTSTGASAGEAIPSQGEIASGRKNAGPRNDIDQENWGITIPLSPLTDQASRELAQELFQQVVNVPENVIDLLVERSEGIPYYTEELVNWFIDQGILDTHSEPWHFLPEKLREQPLPATLQHLLLTRLSSLSQPERAALQRGAIFGRRFWTGGVEALGVPAGADTLTHLQPRGFVQAQPESSFQGDTEWSFHQNLLQEVTYESVLKRERSALHKVAAEWLERQASQAGRLDEFAGLLGEHCERAGELGAAADWYLQAGRRAMAQGAPREAAGFYTLALELLPPVDRQRRWQVLLGREQALSVLGEAQPWKADISALLELARSLNDDNALAEAALRQAICGLKTDTRQIIDQASQEALAAAQRCGNEPIEVKALAITGLADFDRGDRTSALQKTEAALQRARALGDDTVLAYVLFRAAFIYSEIPNIARCYPLYIEQIELDHRLGNRNQEAISLGNLGSGYIFLGMYKQGRAQIEQAIQICQSLGARRGLAYNLGNLGDIYLDTGDLRKARQLLEQALQEISPTQDVRGKTWLIADLGMVLLAAGDGNGASRRLTEARELALSQGLNAMACEITAGLAACAVLQGQLDLAGKYVHEAWDYVTEQGWVGFNNLGLDFRNCAEVFDALGEAENVRAVLERGHQALMEVADTINVPEWRQSFLENVPNNRALMDMWEQRKQ